MEKILKGDLYIKYQVVKENNKLAFYMLQHLAYLDGTQIDFTIINEMFKNEFEFEKSLDYLVEYGFLKEEQFGEKITFIMHESTQNEMENNTQEESEIIGIIIEALNIIMENELNTDIEIGKFTGDKMERIKELEKHGYKVYKKRKYLKNVELFILFLENLIKISSDIFINYFKVEQIP